jgi:hypothetical protein
MLIDELLKLKFIFTDPDFIDQIVNQKNIGYIDHNSERDRDINMSLLIAMYDRMNRAEGAKQFFWLMDVEVLFYVTRVSKLVTAKDNTFYLMGSPVILAPTLQDTLGRIYLVNAVHLTAIENFNFSIKNKPVGMIRDLKDELFEGELL